VRVVRTFFPQTPEADVARYFTIEEWWEFVPGNTEQPYGFIRELYDMRRELKAGGSRTGAYNIREKVIKLCLNSLYGKTAQGVSGGADDAPPSCANPYYAAAITAHVRARLVEAALVDPHAIVSFMTDGIVSMRELKELPRVRDEAKGEEPDLGDWEIQRYNGGFFFMSGLYELGEGKKVKAKTRGFQAKNILQKASDPEERNRGYSQLLNRPIHEFFTKDVLQAWQRGPVLKMVKGEEKLLPPGVVIRLRTFVTAGAACASKVRYKLRGRWGEVTRRIDADSPGGKRTFDGLAAQFYMSMPAAFVAKAKKEQLHKLLRVIYPGMPAKPAMATLCAELFATPEDIKAALRSGEAFRCRFLIPTTPTKNPTPNKLSAPSEPEWLAPGSLGKDERESLFGTADHDTVEVLQGMS
jgi:hypothetical protein